MSSRSTRGHLRQHLEHVVMLLVAVAAGFLSLRAPVADVVLGAMESQLTIARFSTWRPDRACC